MGGGGSGSWKEDLKHGYGLMTFEEGDQYTGNWADGLMHGWGKYTHLGGMFEGDWKLGKMDGNGEFRSLTPNP